MAPALATHLLRERQRAGIERWALASNSRRDLTSIARAIEADVVRARWPIVKPRATYFHRALALLGMPADSVAMVGDKLLHDIEPASRLGMHTVLVHPLAQDQLIDRLMLRRQRERTARKRIEGRGDQTHAPSARPNQAPISKLLPCGAWRASACSPAAATARG
jgi:predicted HAD superfamily phosphohydrolase YqeG